LPAPFGPMINRRSPGITVSDTFRVAGLELARPAGRGKPLVPRVFTRG